MGNYATFIQMTHHGARPRDTVLAHLLDEKFHALATGSRTSAKGAKGAKLVAQAKDTIGDFGELRLMSATENCVPTLRKLRGCFTKKRRK